MRVVQDAFMHKTIYNFYIKFAYLLLSTITQITLLLINLLLSVHSIIYVNVIFKFV